MCLSVALSSAEAVGEWGVVEFVKRPFSLINIHTIYIDEIATLIEFLIKLLRLGKFQRCLIVKRAFCDTHILHSFQVFALFEYSSYRYLLVIANITATCERSLLI